MMPISDGAMTALRRQNDSERGLTEWTYRAGRADLRDAIFAIIDQDMGKTPPAWTWLHGRKP